MNKEETSRNIILSPGTNKIDEFNSRYVFYCEQVLKEIHRQQIQRKLTRDSTPIKIEDELTSCMMTILQRFGVLDIEEPVQCGYFCQLTNEVQDYELVPIILNNMINRNLNTDSMKHNVHTIKVPEYQIEELQDLLKGVFHTVVYDINNGASEHDIVLFEESVARMGKDFLDTVMDRLKWHPFKSKEEIEIDIITFRLTQTVSTIKEFRDMNITTAEIVKMMWTDLFESAIGMQIEIEQK